MLRKLAVFFGCACKKFHDAKARRTQSLHYAHPNLLANDHDVLDLPPLLGQLVLGLQARRPSDLTHDHAAAKVRRRHFVA